MAERPSVQEILARVRAAGPAKSEEATAAEAPPAESAPEPVEPPPAAEAPPAVASAPPPPTPESLGRPLTLKEKLAAAKNRPVGAAPTPAPSAPPPAAEPPAAAAEAPSGSPPPSAAPQLTPEALGRPLTLKEKLAAARAGGGGAAPAAAAKPAAKPAAGASPAPAAAAKAASTRALPPLEQMSDPKDLAEALRRAGAAKEKAAKAAVAEKAPSKAAPKRAESKAVPPRPSKAAAAAGQTATAPATMAATMAPAPEEAAATSRRGFWGDVGWIAAGWAAFVAGIGAFTAMSLRFMFPNVLAEPPSTIKVGIPTNFEMGEVNETWKAEWGFWIVRSDYYDGEDKLYALSSTCTHLGCPPAWLAGEQKFKCPCHGSGFYISGVNFEGPAPRPLERFKITLGDDGQLLVDKAAKYQEELGQWTDPESYFKA